MRVFSQINNCQQKQNKTKETKQKKQNKKKTTTKKTRNKKGGSAFRLS